ncbi:MAG: arginine decarboxylase, pyruvoyl-dependent [Candidatus Thermoplasmatota archaeon]|nr:arginine decarboxylase, pyruvoyl-dependent [Candidatus Thermoplasmatota archaeon]
MVPKKMFTTKGVGRHKHELQSFEMALRDAGIEKFNLVSVSSILPPGCKIVTREEGLKDMKPGQIAFVVMSRNSTNEPNRMVAASVGCAVPADETQYGYISEYHAFGSNSATAGEIGEDLAATMLATTLGIPFDADLDWDERENQYKISGKIVRSFNVTKTAEGDKSGGYTTVLAAAVFVYDSEDVLSGAGGPSAAPM